MFPCRGRAGTAIGASGARAFANGAFAGPWMELDVAYMSETSAVFQGVVAAAIDGRAPRHLDSSSLGTSGGLVAGGAAFQARAG